MDLQMGKAAELLAHTARFPTFAGATFAFTDAELEDGAWLYGPPGHPLEQLAFLNVRVPVCRGDSWPLAVARCRIAIEDALASAPA